MTTAGEEDGTVREGEDKALSEEQKKWYRGVVARANYYSLDRPDIAYATKEACRKMSDPAEKEERRVRRLGRYLVGQQRVVQRFPWQEEPEELKVFTDSDWAGCGPVGRARQEGRS